METFPEGKESIKRAFCCCSVAQSCPTLCDPMDCSTPGFSVLHYLLESEQTPGDSEGLQHTRLLCPSLSPGVCSDSCPLNWCHPTISSSVIPFSSCPQSFPASGSFPMSRLFASDGQSIGVSASASVLPMNIQD